MANSTTALARSITWANSKQTYFTARLMVDGDLVDDFYRAYAYFRWADDIVDVSSESRAERIAFVTRQRELIDHLYNNEQPDGLAPEELIAADLIGHDRGHHSGLQSFIRNMLAIIEFDARRKGRLISQQELLWYSDCLGRSVVDGLQYFIGNGHPYPDSEIRYLAARGAHIAHLLRDMVPDTAAGFINIPREYLEQHGIGPHDVDSPPFREWVRSRVARARGFFREGRRYLDGLDVLRCKTAGNWYCARFEGVLETIERDSYVLRPEYNERHKPSTWLKVAGLGVSLTLRHISARLIQ